MWRTFLLVYVIMASGGATGGAEGGTTDYEMTQESSRSEVCRSKYYTDNRYEVLAEGVGYPQRDSSMDWKEQSRKRRRRETGSVDLDAFCKMPDDQKLIAMFTKLLAVESKQISLSEVVSPVYEKVDILEDCVNIHARKLKMLSYRSLDLEARSRRNNLIFRGLADCRNENCAGLIIDFLAEEMQIDINSNDIVRAHRLGSYRLLKSRYQVPKRPIIVAFKDYSLVERIMGDIKKLWGKPYRVEKDFPAEITEARKNLWPKLKAEKAKNPNCKLTIGYPAKLIKNNRVIADEFPEWRRILRTSRVQGFESVESDEEYGYEGSSEINREQTGSEHVFRPWQRPQGHGRNTENDSDSGSSVIGPTQPQHTRKKLFTKHKMNGNVPSELKMTEKMKLIKGNNSDKSRKRLPFMISRNSASKPHGFGTNVNFQSESRPRSSSVPDMSRGNVTRAERGQSGKPINEQHSNHVSRENVNNENMNEHSDGATSQNTGNTQQDNTHA